ncbi:MAG TPA: selenocysteine-specific translation elongation factor [Anaerolineae bacterium]|nr:selenocysteine-specific translation elongation factor [Anaerolineae bacterium]
MSRIVVVGTAGHVDHGKSTLVRALTGTDPDRLSEEKRRGMTIDLGFAWMRLPGGDVLSLVDVPGHEDFIRNMLAGAGGVDAGILVVAADEGPMPQTREHLAILDLLGLRHCLVALTKTDLVDAEWIALVTEDLRAMLAPTCLADAPIVPVSAETGAGLDRLLAALEQLVRQAPEPVDRGRPRLSVDRSFSLAGFGTVVTGTLRDGGLRVGDTVSLLPQEQLRSRIRGLHAHGQATEEARPGSRTAINLVGVEPTAIPRGTLVSLPDQYAPTRLVDVRLRALADLPHPLAHDLRLQVYHGAAETPAFLRVIGAQAIDPGSEGDAQLRLERPLVLAAGDRLVLRLPSPERTVGGARVLDCHPPGRRRRFADAVSARFADLATGEPTAVVWQMLAEREPCAAERLRPVDLGFEAPERDLALEQLSRAGRVLSLEGHWATDRGWARLRRLTELILRRYHDRHPLRPGVPMEELRGQLRLAPEVMAAVTRRAVEEGWLQREGELLHDPRHSVRFSSSQDEVVKQLLGRFRAQPFAPPSVKEAEAEAGARVLEALVKQGDLVLVSPEVLFDRQAYGELRQGVVDLIQTHGPMTLADMRDRFNTSRKFAQAILEHFDRQRLTRRIGDTRVLVSPPGGGGATEQA